MSIVAGRTYVPSPPSRAPAWIIASALVVLALAILVLAIAPAVTPKPYEPPPWHRYDERIGALEQSVMLIDRRLTLIELSMRRPTGEPARPTGSPIGSPTGSTLGSPIGDQN